MPGIRLAALLASLSLLLPAPASAQFYGDLARTNALTAADDYRIGKGYVDTMSWLWGTVEDDALQRRVEDVVRKVVSSSDRPDQVFNITILAADDVNAAALPGGFLLIHKGLLDNLTDEQIAFVIAHEVAHVQLRHFATTMNMSRALQVLGVAEGSVAEKDRGTAEKAAEEMASMSRAYARDLELEADLYGMLFAMRAGWSSKSGPAAMARMKELVGEVMPHEAEMQNHPSFEQRIAELEKGRETFDETFRLFEAGVGYSRAGAPEAAVPAFQQFLALFPRSAAAWSNLGTVWLQQATRSMPDDGLHDDLPLYNRSDVTVRAVDTAALERARSALKKAIDIDPNRDAALGNLGVLARREGDLDGAEALLKQAIELDGKYAGYRSNLGNVYVDKKDWKQADKAFSKARKLDGSADYVRGNQATLAERRGKKKDAVAAWEALLTVPSQAQKAHARLVALGARAESAAPAVQVATAEEEAAQGLLVLLGSLGEGNIEDVLSGPDGDLSQLEGISVEESTEAKAPPKPREERDSKVGSLKLGASLADLTAALGEPEWKDGQDDGFYVYAAWTSKGVEVVFVDDSADSFQVGAPSGFGTGRGIAVGAARDKVVEAYGGAEYTFGDPDLGFETLVYDSLGLSFFFGEGATVEGFSVWSI